MHFIINIFRKIKKIGFSHRYNKAILFLIFIAVSGAALMYVLEKDSNPQFASIGDGLWWAMATVTTVGYGDKAPITPIGRLLAGVVMMGGIGSFGFIAGSILEEFVEKGRGRMNIKFGGHYVICGYNYKAESIVMELKKEMPDCKIVLIADRDENPLLAREDVGFVRGDSAREAVLEKANIREAKTVIVLADDQMEPQYADAHSVLTTLAVKELNPAGKLVAESMHPENTHHLLHAGANEIVCVGDISTKLISRASIHLGMTDLISELMTNNSGNELYSAEAPDLLVNECFETAFMEFRKQGAILIGVIKGGVLSSNPPPDCVLEKSDHLIYIAPERVI